MRRGSVSDTMIENGDFLLVAKHGTLQVKGANVDFTPNLDGFTILFDEDNKIIKDFKDINDFFDYAEKQKSILHFRTSIYNMDISAQVTAEVTDGWYPANGKDYDRLLTLKTVKHEKV